MKHLRGSRFRHRNYIEIVRGRGYVLREPSDAMAQIV